MDASTEADSAYHGVDFDHAVEARDLRKQRLLAAKRRLTGGLGHPDAPRADPIMKELYGDRDNY